ncbi:MAG: response regulator transcription factor [Candidatus Fimenecus sp.]
MEKILIIEDDKDIAEIESDYLTLEGFSVDIAFDGIKGLDLELKNRYSLILLDLMLPGTDGFIICEKLRNVTDVPILMLTALKADVDKIKGLGVGADDYIEKPFSPSELVARVKANISQYKRLKDGGFDKDSVLEEGGVKLNRTTRRVRTGTKEIDLKNKEYELLLYLMMNADKVISRNVLYENIWGMDSIGDEATVTVHINRLREKLEDDPQKPKIIETVWGAGYRFKK